MHIFKVDKMCTYQSKQSQLFLVNGLYSENVNYEIIVQYYVMFRSLFSQICLLCEFIRSIEGRLGSESIFGTSWADSLFEDNGTLSRDLL